MITANELLDRLQAPDGAHVIALIGPSRSGKTQLVRDLEHLLGRDHVAHTTASELGRVFAPPSRDVVSVTHVECGNFGGPGTDALADVIADAGATFAPILITYNTVPSFDGAHAVVVADHMQVIDMESVNATRTPVGIGAAAEHHGVSTATVRRWIKAGRLPAMRLPSGVYRIRIADLDALAEPVNA